MSNFRAFWATAVADDGIAHSLEGEKPRRRSSMAAGAAAFCCGRALRSIVNNNIKWLSSAFMDKFANYLVPVRVNYNDE